MLARAYFRANTSCNCCMQCRLCEYISTKLSHQGGKILLNLPNHCIQAEQKITNKIQHYTIKTAACGGPVPILEVWGWDCELCFTAFLWFYHLSCKGQDNPDIPAHTWPKVILLPNKYYPNRGLGLYPRKETKNSPYIKCSATLCSMFIFPGTCG